MQVKIPHHCSSEPCCIEEVPDDTQNPLRAAVLQAVARRADLTGADLTDADMLKVIRATDTTRPDGAIAKSLVTP